MTEEFTKNAIAAYAKIRNAPVSEIMTELDAGNEHTFNEVFLIACAARAALA